MPHLPLLRVVPLESIRRHEEIDPLRVERLIGRIQTDGVQVNPMVCSVAPDDQLILLDGATRTESLKEIGLAYAVVQIVGPEDVRLETWHHVVRGTSANEVLAAIGDQPHLLLGDEDGTPRVHLREAGSRTVLGAGVSPNATLSSLVASYVGEWGVTRVVDSSVESVSSGFDDWAALIEFPTLSLDDVVKAATSDDLLPAGITRFLVNERALRVNVPLGLLMTNDPIDSKQAALEKLLDERTRNGQVRRYEETVFILDE